MTETPHMQLLPCPFCGWSRNESYADAPCGDRRYWTVICDQCEAHGPPFSECSGGEKEAIAAWNTRATTLPTTANNPETDAHRELVEALREAIGAIEDDTGLDEAICCGGHDCGCRAATHRQLLLHNLRAALTKAEVPHGIL